MFRWLITVTCLWAAVANCGVVQDSGLNFCSRNPTSARCISIDRRDHPDLPEVANRQEGATSEANQKYWTKMASDIVTQHMNRKENENKAKNVIFFLGDGMGIQSVTAARMLLGNENKQLSFEEFPWTGSVKTYCVDTQVADSACTATAYLAGVKTNEGMTGINARIKRYDCEGQEDETAFVDSIAKWAQTANKATGLVTTTRVTHASPSGLYAHTANRDWESDYCVQFKDCDDGLTVDDNLTGCDATKIEDISKQLIRGDVGSKFNVILGGGRRGFFDNSVQDELGVNGQRTDGLNLMDEWLNDGKQKKKIVKVREDLLAVNANETDYLLGLFGQGSHLKYHLQAEAEGVTNEPTLWEMTEKALEIVSKNENGFFLFVEGGKIDLAHHDTYARAALREMTQFEETIRKTRELFSEEDTLIIVSADHSHTMSISGYPDRGNDIFGFTRATAKDDLRSFTLSYANGPSYNTHIEKGVGRKDPTKMDTSAWNFEFPVMVNRDSETHGGEDVPIYASGPWSHLFTGTLEQNVIPHYLAYAACIGDGLTMCDSN